ncbi:MAG TPA: hypothetical protein VMV86_03545 [Methanosarcinales archaeon]|nr:hypothetical protein [Methanosarcinales archaeon]
MKEQEKTLYIKLPEDQHRFIKKSAAQKGQSIKNLVIDAVAYYMAELKRNNEIDINEI